MSETTTEWMLDRAIDAIVDYQNHMDNGWLVSYIPDGVHYEDDIDDAFDSKIEERFDAAAGYFMEHRAELAALRAERDELLAALTGVLVDTHQWNYEFDPYGGDFPTTCKFCYERFYIPERHAPDCPWRVAVELRDRLAREAQHER